MDYIKLINTSQNHDSSSMSIVQNKNMNIISSKINSIIDVLNVSSTANVFSVLTHSYATAVVEDENFLITRTINQNIATYTITSKISNVDLTKCIVAIREFSGHQILCPIQYSTDKIEITIDNIDDVVPDAFSQTAISFAKVIAIAKF